MGHFLVLKSFNSQIKAEWTSVKHLSRIHDSALNPIEKRDFSLLGNGLQGCVYFKPGY